MSFIYRQIRVFKQSWQIIISKPIEHLINLLALGLIVGLCLTSLSVNKNIRLWQQNNIIYPQIYVYLDNQSEDADKIAVQKYITSVENNKMISSYKFVSKEEALKDVAASDSSMKDIASDVSSSNDNPLPDVFILNAATVDSKDLDLIAKQLKDIPIVDNVQLDVNYANKINDLVGFTNNVALAVQLLLVGVLCLFVYNIIRLQMMLKSDAIKVSRLIGASDGFIMAPLLQYAFWQVALAMLVGVGMQSIITSQLNNLFQQFTHLFDNSFVMNSLSISDYLMTWIELTAFTLFSVFLAVRWVLNHTKVR